MGTDNKLPMSEYSVLELVMACVLTMALALIVLGFMKEDAEQYGRSESVPSRAIGFYQRIYKIPKRKCKPAIFLEDIEKEIEEEIKKINTIEPTLTVKEAKVAAFYGLLVLKDMKKRLEALK